VLCYHYLRRSPGALRFVKVLLTVVLSLPVLDDNELWTLSEGTFEKQMRWLHENGYQTITLDQLTEWQFGHRALPEKAVVITFDDGDRSVYDYAWPILEKYGFTASYFVITREVGHPWQGLDMLSWQELREMAVSGTFTIQSHTHDLHFKVGDKNSAKPVFLAAYDGGYSFDGFANWEDRLYDDLRRSRHVIKLKVGRAPRYLAWPYGHSEPYLDLLARDAGFTRTMLLEAGTNESFVPAGADTVPLVDRVPIRRYAITARTSLRTFAEMVRGEYFPPEASDGRY
jgi:biofilm PGA synthesis lipoprotein PgaB